MDRPYILLVMKKYILLLLLFSTAVSAQHSRQSLTHPDYDDFNLKSWPRQVTVVQHYASGNDINFQEVYLFDSTGHLAEYRKQGFGGERVTIFPLTMAEANGWSTKEQVRYRFDYDGDLLETRTYDMKGRFVASAHYIYAEGGNLVQHVEYTYDADSGVVVRRSVFDYDKHERLVRMAQYSADELLLGSEKRKYDRRGNLVKRTQIFYDEATSTDDGISTTVEQRKYTYDRWGNWIRCSYILNGKNRYTIERTIVYYGE